MRNSADSRQPISIPDAEAAIFDLDGVITRTAGIHARAWKELFDDYLARHAAQEDEPFRPFDAVEDYRRYVDGKPRHEGVRSFLESRGITLPYGAPDDPPDRETICGLGNRKNDLFIERIHREGVEVFESSVAFIRALRSRGVRTALVSSSRNAAAILSAAGLNDLFDVCIDGVEAARLGLQGKPAPDTFLEAAKKLDVDPAHALVVEDAVAGVRAGRAGGFGLVVGVDPAGRRTALQEGGGDVVVADLAEILPLLDASPRVRKAGDLPDALDRLDLIAPRLHDRRPVVFHRRGPPLPPHPRHLAGEPDTLSGWKLIYDDFDPAQESLREALCTLGNGYFATRGAAEEAEAGDAHYPGTYLAGGYNRLRTDIAGRIVENEDLVNMPNWLPLRFRPEGGEWFNLMAVEVLAYRQELDLRQGVLTRDMHIRDRQGRETRLTVRRIVHMENPHLAALEMVLVPENWSGRVQVRSALDGRAINAGVERYRQLNSKHLVPLETQELGDDGMLLAVETNQSHLRVAQAARTRILREGEVMELERRTLQEEGYIAQELSFEATEGQPVTVEKVIALHTSRDRAISSPDRAVTDAVRRVGSFAQLLERHALVWSHLWQRCDVILEGQQRTQMILRLHIFHLLQTVSLNTADLDVGVPARGLHGEAYRGHIFWDELFIFPFLDFRIPEITRALLRYRYRRLPEARMLARASGYQGAMYPWQSGSTGREESQILHLNPKSGRWLPDNSYLQRHVNSAIAYNVWRYHATTGDQEFLNFYGAEMLIEIARFWASIATYNADRDRYEIRGIMGPDEFHDRYPWAESPGIDNNAYTNIMAAWVLRRALDALECIDPGRRAELWTLLALGEDELARWDTISRRLCIPFHDGIVSQFEGYERLEELDWDGYRRKYGDIHRLDRILEAEGDTVNRYKASKQADALMLFYLFSSDELYALFGMLGYTLAPEMIPRTIDYYLHRTSEGSTLSRIVHSWVLARSDRPRSWKLLTEALESDIRDIQGGTTAEGIHLGAMAGTVDLVQRGQTGLEIRDGTLRLDPCLPEELQGLRLKLRYCGHWLELDIGCERMIVSVPDGWAGPDRIIVHDQVHPLRAGERLEFPCRLEKGGWRPKTRDVTHESTGNRGRLGGWVDEGG